jgi:uncharacterized protein (TIGR03435 family)
MRHLSRMVVLFIAAVAVAAAAQAPAQKPSFEAASVKPNKSAAFTGTTIGAKGSTFSGVNVTPRMLLQYAYQPENGSPLLNDRIIGAPAWMDSDRFDVQAKLAEDARNIPQQQIRLMLQSLLEDRFQLKSRWETRELPVYNLTVTKGGPKLKLSDDQTPPDTTGKAVLTFDPSVSLARGAIRQIAMPSAGGILMTITGSATPVEALVNLLHGYAGRMVIDKTDLTGLFDIRLQFALEMRPQSPGGAATTNITPPLPSDPLGPTIFTALQEQLGLRLQSARGSVEVLVLDSVQKPSEN